MSLPQTHRALIVKELGQPLYVDNSYPTPQPTPGTAIVKILSAGILSYSREIYNGQRKYNLPTPSVPGSSAIGRIAAVGKDAMTLKEGDLVLCDISVRGRDTSGGVAALLGVHDGHIGPAVRVMHEVWRDGTYAEYARLPLENCFVLGEPRLLSASTEGSKGLGYTPEDLLHLAAYLVPYGGLRSIGLGVEDTVVIAPATGMFGSGAVHVALAMGANVIALGRNPEALEKLKTDVAATGHHIDTVRITNDVQQDVEAIANFAKSRGGVDVFFDISPPEAEGSTHIKSGILSLKRGGRVSFMGGYRSDVGIPMRECMRRDVTLKGKWMYEREDVVRLIQMVESGRLKLGEKAGCRVTGRYGLEQWKEAFDAAAEQAGPGQIAVFVP